MSIVQPSQRQQRGERLQPVQPRSLTIAQHVPAPDGGNSPTVFDSPDPPRPQEAAASRVRRWATRWRSRRPLRQRRLPFLERTEHIERRFKRAIAATTAVVVVVVVTTTPIARYNLARFLVQTWWTVAHTVSLPQGRWAADTNWRLRRTFESERTRRTYETTFTRATPETQRLLAASGFAPADAVIRWGNYNLIFVLSSQVFAPDDQGRSYRLRPNVRSVWLKHVALSRDVIGLFLLPDTPELRRLVDGTGAYIVPGSTQNTNSWGCRGPEPDVSAPLRGLALGDSNMQGLLVGDDETPPECLRRELETRLNTRVSMLNTGHLGYSPEQFYHSLVEYGDRFRPHFVVFSFCVNDFGSVFKPGANRFDMEEGKYWINEIFDYCRARKIYVIAAPVPHEEPVTGARREGIYPGRISDILPINSLWYCNPFDAFADEQTRLDRERRRRGEATSMSPLFNGPHHDVHMSAAGTALWGKVVGRRLALLLERERLEGRLGDKSAK